MTFVAAMNRMTAKLEKNLTIPSLPYRGDPVLLLIGARHLTLLVF